MMTWKLNVAAMLDMAFQLLAFFILTFKPSAVESQIMMRLPNDKPVTQAPSTQISATDVVDEGLIIPISIYSTPEGDIEKIEFGQRVLSAPTVEELLPAFRAALAEMVQDGGSDTVSIRVGEDLRYEWLMQVVDICGKQKLANGDQLSKVSIVPLKAN